MAWIICWQFMGWPASRSTLAAASRALSFLVWAASWVFEVAALVVPVFLALGCLVRWATPSAALRLVQRSLVPVAGASAPAAAFAPAGPAGTPSVDSVVLVFLLAMSGLPIRGW